MSDMAEGYYVRAYSDFTTEGIVHLCEYCFEFRRNNDGQFLMLIEEYEGEDTLEFVPTYTCEDCGAKQSKEGEVKPMTRTFNAEIREVHDGSGFVGEITSITGAGNDLMDNLESLKSWVTPTPEEAGRQLKNFLNGLGLAGTLRVTFVNEIVLDATPDEAPTGESDLPKAHADVQGVEWTDVASHTDNKTYRVSWDPRYRADGNHGFKCGCNHFFYRLNVHNRDGQMKGGICKHIEEAVDRGLADGQEIIIPGVTFRF